MKTYIVVGGSRGIGNAIVKTLLENHKVINISRTKPELSHENLNYYECDILKDELPEINVIGAVKAIQKYLNSLKNGNDPSIVLFSTVAAKLGMPFHASVAAAKSGVEGLVKSLGAELATTLRINAIAPTVTNTDLASKLLRNEKMIENITERHPMKKFLQPEDVAGMAEFLLSEKSSSISGQVFEMDCGIVTFKI